jgi:hypothetical protein
MSELSFGFLDDDSLDLLEVDYLARVAYVDMLSLLHDLLAPFCTDSERARFSPEEIHRDLEHLIHTFSSGRQIGMTARANVSAAETLYSQFSRTDPQKPEFAELRTRADAFVSDLLRQYNLIRVIRTPELQPEPA